jgi:ribonuclease VapC
VIVVDSSAVCAILFAEDDADRLLATLNDAEMAAMSAANYFETAMVVESRLGPAGVVAFEDFFRNAAVDILSVDRDVAELARQAFRAYGKGRHKAALNFGDCIAYATAKLRDAPLLAKGGDFQHTDIRLAM